MRLSENEDESSQELDANNQNKKYSLDFINNADDDSPIASDPLSYNTMFDKQSSPPTHQSQEREDEKHSLNFIMASNSISLPHPNQPSLSSVPRSSTISLPQDSFMRKWYDQIGIQSDDAFASRVLDRLYLGSLRAVLNEPWLRDHKITHILTVADSIRPPYPESYIYKIIPVRDHRAENISQYFDTTYEFIQQALGSEDGVVLVHCQQGISRSASGKTTAIHKMSDPLTEQSPLASETAELQQLDESSDPLTNLNGWSLIGSEKEDLPMNEHQTGYLTAMYASEVMPNLYLGRSAL
ncbi:1177_t:CDS:2 [Acaulospora colombiana]|uniref:1177_t:CDS:1 n=1 Tax=Acaulospora colombiana TaxID=27376 RepID=A0ACA9LMD2_9GLOM|nr:1177_t:CDS:2 [Acaulospora colombiana]